MDDPDGAGAHLNNNNNNDDVVEVIELDGDANPDDLADEMEDVDFADECGDDEEDDDDDDYNEWASEADDGGESVPDDSEFTVKKHKGAVFCVALDPKSNALAVTGGEDDLAYVWRVGDGEILFPCTGHKDSVTCAGFSHDSSMVATGDMSGLIKVWSSATAQELWSFEVSDLEWIEWHHKAPVLLAGTNSGEVWMWKIPAGDCRTFQGPGCQSMCGKIFPDGKGAVVGYEDGTVRIWDLKQSTPVFTFKGKDGHQGSVTCLAVHDDGTLVLTGSVDRTASLLNVATGKVLHVFTLDAKVGMGSGAGAAVEDEEEAGSSNSVESVGFCKVHPLIAVGYLDGTLVIWDVPSQTLRHRLQEGVGVVKLQWDLSSATLFVCSLDGRVRLYDGRSGASAGLLQGHRGEVLDFALSRDSSMLVTASGDHTAKVFHLQKPDR
ncbi:unnamed protein product [Lampetra planeri]